VRWAVASFALMGFLGCGEAVVSDRREDPLLDGAETWERPEVGLISVGGIRCTATLVTDRVLVSAAHCLGYRSASASGNYGTFTVRTGPDAAPLRFQVARYRSFSRSLGRTDVALLLLSSPVPSTVARPAGLARARPSVGERLTVYGYGCTVRGTQIGFGTKRKRDFLEGQRVDNLCPGDSGGPVIHASTNEVSRVNSSYGSYDGFGDVPTFYEEIRAQITAWGESLERPAPPAPAVDAGSPPAPPPPAPEPAVDAGAPPAPPPPMPPEPAPDAGSPPGVEACGRYAGWSVRTCISDVEAIRCVNGALARTACEPGGSCLRRPTGYDDVCIPPAGEGEPCGQYAWINVFTCNQSRTQRVLCANGRLLREPCERGCLVRRTGIDDVCAP
jgi:hypothetical protein